MKSKTWTWKTSYTLLSHESNTWSKAACIEWCEGAALKPKNHTFVNAHWQPRPVCQLRKSLHNGEKLRCGWDVNTHRCNLFVGGETQETEGSQPTRFRSTVRDCKMDLSNIAACSPLS